MSLNRLRKRLRADDGLSLAELLVGMMVTSILLAIVGSLFVNVAKITLNSNATTARAGVGTNIMDALSKGIRTAVNNPTSSINTDPAIISGTTKSLSLYTYLDAKVAPGGAGGIAGKLVPTKVTYTVDAKGNLIEERVLGTDSAGYWTFTGTAIQRVVGGPILTPTGDAALFLFYDADGNNIALTAASDATMRAKVTSVRVNVQITNKLTSGNDPILISNTITLINLKPSTSGKK